MLRLTYATTILRSKKQFRVDTSIFQTYVNTLAKGLYQYMLVVAFEKSMLGLEISFVVSCILNPTFLYSKRTLLSGYLNKA